MRIKRITMLIIACTTLVAACGSVFASDLSSTLSDNLTLEMSTDTSYEDSYIDMSELMPLSGTTEIQSASEMAQYVNDAKVSNFASVNEQFEALKSELSLDGWGDTSEIEIPSLSSGYSSDLETKFNETFKSEDIKKSLEEATLPEGFSVSSMMESVSQMRDSAQSEFLNSDTYQSVLNKMSQNSTLQSALQSSGTYSLLSNSELQDTLSSVSSAAKSNNDSVYSSALASFNTKDAANKSSVPTASFDYDSAVAAKKAEIESYKSQLAGNAQSLYLAKANQVSMGNDDYLDDLTTNEDTGAYEFKAGSTSNGDEWVRGSDDGGNYSINKTTGAKYYSK